MTKFNIPKHWCNMMWGLWRLLTQAKEGQHQYKCNNLKQGLHCWRPINRKTKIFISLFQMSHNTICIFVKLLRHKWQNYLRPWRLTCNFDSFNELATTSMDCHVNLEVGQLREIEVAPNNLSDMMFTSLEKSVNSQIILISDTWLSDLNWGAISFRCKCVSLI